MHQSKQQQQLVAAVCVALALAAAVESVAGVITVQIGGATRLNSLSRQRDRYSCYWDCDLVGCQIARDDDECAYDCEKICRVRYDYASSAAAAGAAAGRSGATPPAAVDPKPEGLSGKSGAPIAGESAAAAAAAESLNEMGSELIGGEFSNNQPISSLPINSRRSTNLALKNTQPAPRFAFTCRATQPRGTLPSGKDASRTRAPASSPRSPSIFESALESPGRRLIMWGRLERAASAISGGADYLFIHFMHAPPPPAARRGRDEKCAPVACRHSAAVGARRLSVRRIKLPLDRRRRRRRRRFRSEARA